MQDKNQQNSSLQEHIHGLMSNIDELKKQLESYSTSMAEKVLISAFFDLKNLLFRIKCTDEKRLLKLIFSKFLNFKIEHHF